MDEPVPLSVNSEPTTEINGAAGGFARTGAQLSVPGPNTDPIGPTHGGV
uniref:Unannotated protein n=1 Tax=freshwater metagenome TaxID=449393 RepID=A0A6J7P5W2_9ZZZZ